MRLKASIDITLRFKEAIEQVGAREGRGMKARFCRNNDINYNQLTSILKNPEIRTLPPYYIACLCRDYGISTDWILMGRDDMKKTYKEWITFNNVTYTIK